MEAVRGQEIFSEGQNEALRSGFFEKKVLIKVAKWPQKPLLWTISRRSFTIFLQKWVKLNVGRWKRHTTEGKTIEALKSSHTPSPCNPDTTQIATTTHTADPVEDLNIWGEQSLS